MLKEIHWMNYSAITISVVTLTLKRSVISNLDSVALKTEKLFLLFLRFLFFLKRQEQKMTYTLLF